MPVRLVPEALTAVASFFSGLADLGVQAAHVLQKLGGELAASLPRGAGRRGRPEDAGGVSCGDLLGHAAGNQLAQHRMEPARDLVLGPAQVPVPPGPHLQHRGVIIGADLAPGPRAQRRDRHRQGIVRVVLIAGPGGQQPHPGTQLRLNAGHPLAGRDQLLGQQVTPARPRPPPPRSAPATRPPMPPAAAPGRPRRGPAACPAAPPPRRSPPRCATPCAGPRRSSLPSSARSKSSIRGYRTAAGMPNYGAGARPSAGPRRGEARQAGTSI